MAMFMAHTQDQGSSRISNDKVLVRAGCPKLTEVLRKRRLQMLGKVVRAPVGHPLRAACFVGSTTHPVNDFYVRRRGRPCKEWPKEVVADACWLFGSMAHVEEMAANIPSWNAALGSKLSV